MGRKRGREGEGERGRGGEGGGGGGGERKGEKERGRGEEEGRKDRRSCFSGPMDNKKHASPPEGVVRRERGGEG